MNSSRDSSRDSCRNSSKDSRRKDNSICGGRSSSTNASRNNRLSDYVHVRSWSASQLQFQLFARTSASALYTITAVMGTPELHVLHAPHLCFRFSAMHPRKMFEGTVNKIIV